MPSLKALYAPPTPKLIAFFFDYICCINIFVYVAQIHTHIHTNRHTSCWVHFVVVPHINNIISVQSVHAHIFLLFPCLSLQYWTEYSRQVVLNNTYFHTRHWKTWCVMGAQFLLHALLLGCHPADRGLGASVPPSGPRSPQCVFFRGSTLVVSIHSDKGTVQTAGEKGRQWYCTAPNPEFCISNLSSEMCSLVQDWHEV